MSHEHLTLFIVVIESFVLTNNVWCSYCDVDNAVAMIFILPTIDESEQYRGTRSSLIGTEHTSKPNQGC